MHEPRNQIAEILVAANLDQLDAISLSFCAATCFRKTLAISHKAASDKGINCIVRRARRASAARSRHTTISGLMCMGVDTGSPGDRMVPNTSGASFRIVRALHHDGLSRADL